MCSPKLVAKKACEACGWGQIGEKRGVWIETEKMMKALAIAAIYAQSASAVPYGPVLDEPSPRRPDAKCESAGEEIVVCAKVDHPKNQRIDQRLDVAAPEGLPPAEVNFGDVKVGLRGEMGSVGGFTSPRVMLRVTIPFGRRK